MAEGGGWLFTGRLSLRSHPWLADHAVFGTVLLPGTAFLELALHAAGQVGLDTVEELTLQAPLILGEGDAVALRVAVAEADDQGAREVTISSRHGEDEDEEWTRHAGGVSAPGVAGVSELPAPSFNSTASAGPWPPEGAAPLDPAAAVYGRLAELGFDYGPAFQGLTAIWRRGEEIFAEVALDRTQAAEAGRFGVRTRRRWTRASIPPIETFAVALGQSRVPLPFSFRGGRLERSARGGAARRDRPHRRRHAALTATDTEGAPVVAIDSLATRPVEPSRRGCAPPRGECTVGARLGRARAACGRRAARLAAVGDGRFRVERCYADPRALAAALDGGAEPPDAVLVPAPGAGGDCSGGGTRRRATDAGVVAGLAGGAALGRHAAHGRDPRSGCGGRGRRLDLTVAPLWGLVRSAQAEHPGRFAAVDLDGADASFAALPAALGIEEPQLALRRGAALVPRLARISTASEGSGGSPSTRRAPC